MCVSVYVFWCVCIKAIVGYTAFQEPLKKYNRNKLLAKALKEQLTSVIDCYTFYLFFTLMPCRLIYSINKYTIYMAPANISVNWVSYPEMPNLET